MSLDLLKAARDELADAVTTAAAVAAKHRGVLERIDEAIAAVEAEALKVPGVAELKAFLARMV